MRKEVPMKGLRLRPLFRDGMAMLTKRDLSGLVWAKPWGLLALLLLPACGSLPLAASPQGQDLVAQSMHAPVEWQVVACIDRSTSYRFTDAAIGALADILPQLQGEGVTWTVHLRWIQENSYRPEAYITTVHIEALPPEPVEPPPPQNPLERRRRSYLGAMSRYQQAKQAWQEETKRVRERALQQAEAVRAITWGPAYGSDIWGCLQKAGELLAGKGGRVIIASDMEVYGPQQRATVNLKGARVHIVFWQADQAQKGEELRRQWTAWLSEAGVNSVGWHDPSLGLAPVLEEIRRR